MSTRLIYSNDLTSSKTHRSASSVWSKLTNIFHRHEQRRDSLDTVSSRSSDSADSSSSYSVPEYTSTRKKRQRKQLKEDANQTSTTVIVPPYSPTYCKPNEFPYSNFYVQLPDGTWMVRYRTGDRDILRTDAIESYMI
ncbi:hypothetical protein J3Q64DRAFT_1256988 [Phycomyces blakesleeanus]|uniref:Uncharacterized protein n=2 Tax=Phycomyces blakesleeanus TaxID=4837 RepID=A0A167KWT0_PHYB8|nr:hypothetical protein PHYBLDRAFT_150064 [Phycomyces blakesleeanus NRRL 1555(-)]OAD69067.1 hypothetical protein PHYBLDRAFT_150064 [Phycomyces blakesleeanus NRRL 1555(-)]|eukprot:XP_018287107.1 hypothetical protein PHYBLDRAFT_150064 [Phycomyces blakesleeanus NRRL 1555(-)]